MPDRGDARSGWDVFVSYSRSDSARVQALVAGLRARGLRVWVDSRDIRPSTDWRAEIRAGIDGSDAVLVMVSSASVQSDECDEEWSYAVDRGKKLVPIQLDGVDPEVVRPEVAAVQFVVANSSASLIDDVVAALAHDANAARLHTMIGLRAQAWESDRDGWALLRGAELETARDWVSTDRQTPRPTQLHRQFIEASERAAADRRDRADLAASLVRGLAEDGDDPASTCGVCGRAVPAGAESCPYCSAELRSRPERWSVPMSTLAVAVLLTDIEGSTRLWQEHAAVMPVVLMQHHRAVAEVVAAHGGRLPPDQGEGDARLAVFTGDDAEAVAVRTALALQGRLAVLDLPAHIRLRVRMAVDVGEVVEFEGNVFGTVVNRCARLRGLGHGGQVLVSHDVARACAGVSLTDLGSHQLRDVADPLHVFQVDPLGVPNEFPPLVGLPPVPVLLPAAVGTLFGREAEMEDVTSLLREHRFVTLTGAGGTGKTTLATEVARSMAAEFSGGVYFVNLVPVADVGDVGLAVATALGFGDRDNDPWSSVAVGLGSARALVVLDNCEDFPDLRDALTTLGAAALTKLTVLATSRRPIGLEREVVVPVPPLATSAADAESETRLMPSSAEQLLLARALEARSGLVVDASAALDLSAVARRLDGIPLALELAAARLRMQSIASLRASLDNSLEGLTDVTGRHPERHRALDDVLAWSVDHLDAESRHLLAALSVFAASPDLGALAGVAGRSEGDVLAPLSRLLDASLARVVELADGLPRFNLLVPVREHVRRATPVDVADDLADRHAQHFLSWARDGSQTRHNTEADQEWIVEVGVVRDDALQALDRLIGRSPQDGVELTVHLCALWFEHGEWVRGSEEFARALAAHHDSDDPFVILAELFRWWGGVAGSRDPAAVPRLLADARRIGDPRLVALAGYLDAVWYKTQGDFDTARREVATVEELSRRVLEREEAGLRPLSGMSRASLIRGLILPFEIDLLWWVRRGDAVSTARQALAERRGPSDPGFRACAVNLAELLAEDGEVDAAEEVLRLVESGFAAANVADDFAHAWIHLHREEWGEALARLAADKGRDRTDYGFCRDSALACDIHLLRGDVASARTALEGVDGMHPTALWTLPAARAARVALADGARGEASAWLDRVAPALVVGEASPGALTYLLTRAMLAKGDERTTWLENYDGLVAATRVRPWPRDAADRAALGPRPRHS